jgi:hypothetical protein
MKRIPMMELLLAALLVTGASPIVAQAPVRLAAQFQPAPYPPAIGSHPAWLGS